MLIFDQLKKDDRQLRLLALVVFSGMFMLLAGLWWVQVVRARDYQTHLETQSFRTVRTPAVRGKILDRNGRVLAENRPNYSVSLYFEDLRKAFDDAYTVAAGRVRAQREGLIVEQEKKLRRKLTKQERRTYALSVAEKNALRIQVRYAVASNLVAQVNSQLEQPEPQMLDPGKFQTNYTTRLALPYPVLNNLTPVQIARFQEQFAGTVGADLEVQSTRVYPLGSVAAHVLGHLQRDDSSKEGEEAFFNYWLPDYRGLVGIEGGFDAHLRGHAGAKSVLVNNLGYRQTETVWSPAEPGHNIVLTLDVNLQKVAEQSVARRAGVQARGAVVVMDVRSGDVLALVSSPTLNPNWFVQGMPPTEMERLNDPHLRPQINRATQENYAPGSIFKTIVGLACLEAGLNPNEQIQNPSHIYVGKRYIDDLAPAGLYDFRRAIVRSSNTYFITNGLRYGGIERIIALGQRLHLGERADLPTRQETAGILPSPRRISSGWYDGDTANICIGQGQIAVSPLQMAVATSALANGGKVYWPRLVDRVEPQDPGSSGPSTHFKKSRVRDELGVRAQNLQILHNAMLAETEDPEGTGHAAVVPGMRICGKTGTAQVTDARNRVVDHTTWFVSFAPYGQPRYAVVVMIESGASGGASCAPIAGDIYLAIREMESKGQAKPLAQTH